MEDLSGNGIVNIVGRIRSILAVGILGYTLNVQAAPHQAADSPDALDKQTIATLDALATGNLAEARILARQMAWRFPKYNLAHLLSAELEATAAFQDVKASGLSPMNQELIDLLLEAQSRLNSANSLRSSSGANDSNDTMLPRSIIQIGDLLDSLLIVDLENSIINHYMGTDKAPLLVRQHYVGSGKAGYGKEIEGDNKTPLGVYRITGKRKGSSLPDLYGSGALTLNYPNALDRKLGRTGYGIWIHGVPHAQSSRAPRSSEGCVTMSNDHMLTLMNQVNVSNTIVVLTRDLIYDTAVERKERQSQFRELFARYQRTLLSDDTDAQVQIYSDSRSRKRKQLTKIQKGYLEKMSAQDLSIIMNPSIPSPQYQNPSQYLVMHGRFGTNKEAQLELFWRKSDNGEWQVFTERWYGPRS